MSDALFDPLAYRAVRRAVEDASTLPPAAYHDPAFYKRELDRLFLTGWNFIGHEGRLPEPGSYAAFDYAGIPVLIIRGSDGVVRGFANTCRHRGAVLVEGEGSWRRLVCPYHGWAYERDGRLAAAAGMEEVRDFRPEENGLLPLKLAQWGPLMWLSFDAAPPPLAEHLGDLAGTLRPYGLDELVLARRTQYDVRCNWKVYVENFMDYYHTPVVHGRSIARGNLSVYHRQRPEVTAGPGQYVMIYTRHAGSAALLPGAQGLPFLPTLDDRATEGSSFACVSPCGLIACTKDCVWYVEIHPTGPQTIRLAVGVCFHRETVAGNDFAERVKPYYERWDVTVDEDNRINEIQQRGVMSPLARAGRVSPLETASHVFRNRLLDALAL